jgi:hypothetical protein
MVSHPALVIAVLPAVVLAAACVAAVDKDADGQAVTVAVSSPVGAMTARTGSRAGNAGLPVYPGARLSRDHGDGAERATVSMATPWFGLHVIAAEYESSDAPERIVEFYREQLKPFGAVTECRGDVDFTNGRAECRSVASSDDVQLLVGTEDHHRIVAIKPRRDGSEFAIVSVQTGRT